MKCSQHHCYQQRTLPLLNRENNSCEPIQYFNTDCEFGFAGETEGSAYLKETLLLPIHADHKYRHYHETTLL